MRRRELDSRRTTAVLPPHGGSDLLDRHLLFFFILQLDVNALLLLGLHLQRLQLERLLFDLLDPHPHLLAGFDVGCGVHARMRSQTGDEVSGRRLRVDAHQLMVVEIMRRACRHDSRLDDGYAVGCAGVLEIRDSVGEVEASLGGAHHGQIVYARVLLTHHAHHERRNPRGMIRVQRVALLAAIEARVRLVVEPEQAHATAFHGCCR